MTKPTRGLQGRGPTSSSCHATKSRTSSRTSRPSRNVARSWWTTAVPPTVRRRQYVHWSPSLWYSTRSLPGRCPSATGGPGGCDRSPGSPSWRLSLMSTPHKLCKLCVWSMLFFIYQTWGVAGTLPGLDFGCLLTKPILPGKWPFSGPGIFGPRVPPAPNSPPGPYHPGGATCFKKKLVWSGATHRKPAGSGGGGKEQSAHFNSQSNCTKFFRTIAPNFFVNYFLKNEFECLI